MFGRLFGGCLGSSKESTPTPREAWSPSTLKHFEVDIERTPFMLKQIAPECRTIEQCKSALRKDPKMISYVPRRYKTNIKFLMWMTYENDELCDLAVRVCPNVLELEHVSKTRDRCLDAATRDITLMKVVPPEHKAYVLHKVQMAKEEYDAVNWLA